MLELEDVISKKIWIWEDINRTFLPYGDTSRLEKRIYFKSSWWVIIREGKKYIGCSNNCEHLEEDNGKIKCSYFKKAIEGEEDNYEPCEECLREYLETEFSSPNMTTEEKSF